VFLLLDLLDGSILVSKLVEVSLIAGSLDSLGLFQSGPPLSERGKLDQVPEIGLALDREHSQP
jgi:hypothetical protein